MHNLFLVGVVVFYEAGGMMVGQTAIRKSCEIDTVVDESSGPPVVTLSPAGQVCQGACERSDDWCYRWATCANGQ